VIEAQAGRVETQMMKTYSHLRRRTLDEAASALEPTRAGRSQSPSGTKWLWHNQYHKMKTATAKVAIFIGNFGSAGRTRTYNPSVNRSVPNMLLNVMGLHGVKSLRILNGSFIHSVILHDIRWISMRIGLGYVTIHVTESSRQSSPGRVFDQRLVA
jgi:hypothetical protein